MTNPSIRVAQPFWERAKSTGLSDAALAAAIGVSPQYYSQIKNGAIAPSARFMAGAVLSGLAKDFSEVAEVVRIEGPAA